MHCGDTFLALLWTRLLHQALTSPKEHPSRSPLPHGHLGLWHFHPPSHPLVSSYCQETTRAQTGRFNGLEEAWERGSPWNNLLRQIKKPSESWFVLFKAMPSPPSTAVEQNLAQDAALSPKCTHMELDCRTAPRNSSSRAAPPDWMGKPCPAWPSPQLRFLGGSSSMPGQGTRLEPSGAGTEHHQETDLLPTAPEGSAPAQVTAAGFTPGVGGNRGMFFAPRLIVSLQEARSYALNS